MEILTAVLVIILTYLSGLIGLWAVKRHRALGILKRYGIPGPEPSFLLGNLHELRSEPTPNDVITKWLKKYGDVCGWYIGGKPHVIIKDLDMIKQVFIKDFYKFSNRPDMHLDISPLNQTLLALKDKRWKEVRAVITPTFSSGKIKLMSQIFNKKIDVTIEVVSKKAQKNEMFDVYELVQGLTLDVIADCALAIKSRCQENPDDEFLVAVQQFFQFAHNRAVDYALMFPFVATVMAFITDYLTTGKMTTLIVGNVKSAISARRQNPDIKSLDILQMILDHERDSKEGDTCLTDGEIIANAYLFLLAGYETTATALAFAFYMLIMHPEIQERLYEEVSAAPNFDYDTIQRIKYMDQFLNETLRLYPPVTGFVSRKSNEDYELGEYTIPKGTNIQASTWDVHHDPELWPDPWKFDPERFSDENKSQIRNLSYFPFGIGPRNCIGARFAQLETKLTLSRLLKKFRFEKCERTDDPLQLICPTVIINPANGIFLRAVERDS